MFKVNDCVRYGAKGVFKIIEIQKRKNKENKKEMWYVLHSSNDGIDTRILTPANNPSLRKVISKEEVLDLLKEMDSMEIVWDDNKRNRDEAFRTILTSGDVYKMLQLIKSIYHTKKDKNKEGKDISQKDKDVFTNAENLLFEELAFSCNIKKEEVLDFILSNQ